MEITYKTIKDFDSKALEELFLSVQWLSGRYPKRLQKALRGSSTVYSAWDQNHLIGLINALDDGEMTAYIHYLLVHPDYQGHGVGSALVERMKKHYQGYLYLLLMVESKHNVPFYSKLNFRTEDATPMAITTP